MNSKICTKCNENKDITEFSKCRSRRDGLQQYCKDCNKKDNDVYRKEKPEYWSYKDGYFSDAEKWRYIKLYQLADKPIKIYMIQFNDGSKYIGSTKMHLNVRLNQHLADYKRGKLFPLLHPKFSEFDSFEDLREHLKNNTFIIEECTGSKTKQYRLEAVWILKLQKQGHNLLNKNIPSRWKNIKV